MCVFGYVVRSATRTTADRSASCPLRDQDTSFVHGAALYRDCAVDTKAKITSNVHPDFRPATPVTGCLSADVEYVVDASGSVETRTARINRSTTEEFGQSVLAMLPQMKFEPAKLGDLPVRQIYLDHVSLMIARTSSGRPPSRAAGEIPPKC